MKLFIGNKNYSSWSMRPWVLLKQAGIEFEEVNVRFDSFGEHSQFKHTLRSLTPAGRVPVLQDGELMIWDSLAIAEYVAEAFADRGLWPSNVADRARARSLCAEMHSGFGHLRSNCPMNIEAHLPEVGALKWRDASGLRADVTRIDQMWSEQLNRHGGPMLFGQFSVVDAFYAPVVMRMKTYALPLSEVAQAYARRVCELPGVQAWVQDALREKDFLDFEEPYRLKP